MRLYELRKLIFPNFVTLMTEMPWKPARPVFAWFFIAAAAGLFLITIINILVGGPSETGVLLGLSAERLALFGTMLVVAAGLGYLGLQTLMGRMFGRLFTGGETKPRQIMDFALGAAIVVFLFSWVTVWTPSERFGTFYYYMGRLYPFLVWLTCFSGAGSLLLLVKHFGLARRQFGIFLREQWIPFSVAGVALLVFGLTAWVVSFRVVNMSWRDEDFWYGAGVPLLGMQVLFATLASVGFLVVASGKFGQMFWGKKYWPDVALFLVTWAVAAFLWAQEPVHPDFFITEPAPPNFELYPDYDARFFDLISQFALIGQDLNNNVFYERPLYSVLLVYLHSFAGQDYEQVVALQAALFAVFPALGYLLGKQLHSRAAGLGLAVLFILRGINSIQAGPFINTAHQKQMMTDFPAAVLMLLITILLIRWVQKSNKNWASLGVAAGILGLATLVRPHPFVYVPVLIAMAVWIYRRTPRVSFALSGLVLVAALAGMLPWLLTGGEGRTAFEIYYERIKGLIRTRYPDLQLPDSMLPPRTQVAALAGADSSSFPTAKTTEKSILASGIDNFLNNLTTSVQGLPNTPYHHDLRFTLKNGENFWKPYWDGAMSPWAVVMLALNLALVALGMGAAWKRAGLSSFIPLGVMLLFYAVNALARTSGGRYLVPVDWVVVFYYFLGILVLVELGFAPLCAQIFSPVKPSEDPQDDGFVLSLNRTAWLHIFGILCMFATLGAFIPLSGKFFERRYPMLTRQELIQQVVSQSGEQLGLSDKELAASFSAPQAVIRHGRILYPRQYEKDQGFGVSIYSFYHPKPYPRMIFTLIGPGVETRVVFPAQKAPPIPNASDAIILGCREDDTIQVWAVLLTDSDLLIKRDPPAPPVCPLVEPVCDNNHHCK